MHTYMYRQLRARRALSIFKMFRWEPEGHYHCTMSIDGNSALMILNRTSLNSDSALLVLNRTSLNSDSALLVLNRTSLNSDSTLLSLKWQYIHLTQSQTFSTFSIHSSIFKSLLLKSEYKVSTTDLTNHKEMSPKFPAILFITFNGKLDNLQKGFHDPKWSQNTLETVYTLFLNQSNHLNCALKWPRIDRKYILNET